MVTSDTIGPPLALPEDTHEAQAARIADYCELHPGEFFSVEELRVACDLGSATKVLSAMSRELGYALEKSLRRCVVLSGTRRRNVCVYRVVRRPASKQLSLLDLPPAVRGPA